MTITDFLYHHEIIVLNAFFEKPISSQKSHR
jgi:hypothetical protein